MTIAGRRHELGSDDMSFSSHDVDHTESYTLALSLPTSTSSVPERRLPLHHCDWPTDLVATCYLLPTAGCRRLRRSLANLR